MQLTNTNKIKQSKTNKQAKPKQHKAQALTTPTIKPITTKSIQHYQLKQQSQKLNFTKQI